MKKFSQLMSPIKVGNITLKNRIIAAPTSMMDLTPDGRLTPYNISYYELKARGGAAVVTVGESITHTETGESHNRQIHMDDPNALPGLRHVVLAIQRNGALANIELSHGGKYGGLTSIAGEEINDKVAYGPSDDTMENGEKVYEMSKEMILEIVKSYGNAAKMCMSAGFDMIMIHAAHGWLFSQFLSPLENKRTDEFGGSLENRARFLMLAIEEVRKVVGPNFPLELRMNGDDFIEGAMSQEDYIQVAKMVQDQVDLINVSAGAHEGEGMFIKTHPSMFMDHGCNVYLAEGIKSVVDIPVSCVGGIHSPELAEEIIASGKADLVELGRALLADPYFPKKAMSGREADITPCIRCYNCFDASINNTVVVCTVNPVIGNEFDNKYYTPVAERPKKVLVAGGGPGGMQAAIKAAEKGHKVTLCDNTDSLGGILKFAEHVPFKKDLHDFSKVLERRVRSEKINLLLNTEVTAETIKSMKPEVLIAATGSIPFIPPIKGIDHPKVMIATEAEKQPELIGDKVVVIGGGLVGCETGIHLAMSGKDVTIVEMRDKLAPEANVIHAMALEIELKNHVKQMPSTVVASITDEGVHCKRSDGSHEVLEADSIVLAAGVKSENALTELADLVEEFYMIGDCVKPAQVMEAVRQGYYTSREI